MFKSAAHMLQKAFLPTPFFFSPPSPGEWRETPAADVRLAHVSAARSTAPYCFHSATLSRIRGPGVCSTSQGSMFKAVTAWRLVLSGRGLVYREGNEKCGFDAESPAVSEMFQGSEWWRRASLVPVPRFFQGRFPKFLTSM
ncbi:hypothetical protein PoB_005601800 [Plakobranchus ocellatus]|uniref:Uncharacterized protein n=1 Tax=Plakobranchus ocellatus TaxID=259542 RepID=A0AAV4CCC1_9GAST|nr:hypothetical protein PoB_005601800 [Plakobranchus ocellatus]